MLRGSSHVLPGFHTHCTLRRFTLHCLSSHSAPPRHHTLCARPTHTAPSPLHGFTLSFHCTCSSTCTTAWICTSYAIPLPDPGILRMHSRWDSWSQLTWWITHRTDHLYLRTAPALRTAGPVLSFHAPRSVAFYHVGCVSRMHRFCLCTAGTSHSARAISASFSLHYCYLRFIDALHGSSYTQFLHC